MTIRAQLLKRGHSGYGARGPTASTHPTPERDSAVHNGAPFEVATRADLKPTLGHTFDDLRVHASDRLRVSKPTDTSEREADVAAARAMMGERVRVVGKPSAPVQRSFAGAAAGVGAGALAGAGIGALFGGLIGAGIGALVGGIAGGFLGSYLTSPLSDMSTFQSPGPSGWWGAKFGRYRNHCHTPHRGWDIHAPIGTSTRAVTVGTLTHHSQGADGWGDYVRLTSKLDPSRVYLYAHLSRRQPPGTYLPGQKVGETGATGNASPDRPHLHFEVRSNGVAEDPSGYFAEPRNVVETVGTAVTKIDKSAPSPCP